MASKLQRKPPFLPQSSKWPWKTRSCGLIKFDHVSLGWIDLVIVWKSLVNQYFDTVCWHWGVFIKSRFERNKIHSRNSRCMSLSENQLREDNLQFLFYFLFLKNSLSINFLLCFVRTISCSVLIISETLLTSYIPKIVYFDNTDAMNFFFLPRWNLGLVEGHNKMENI